MTEQTAQPEKQHARGADCGAHTVELLVRKFIQAGGFDLEVAIRQAAPADGEGYDWVAEFSGPDSDMLLAAHAELLDAFAHIASKAARPKDGSSPRVAFDCQGYLRMRAKELKLTAHLAAERAVESGEPFTLNPMNAADRRAVHLALKDRPQVRTESQGFGADRHVVIFPATSSSSSH